MAFSDFVSSLWWRKICAVKLIFTLPVSQP
jgi:hypothetical protein